MSGTSPPRTERAWARWLPVLLVPVALLPDLTAALPLRTYYFRDFTATFYPLRLFAARELREGRFAFWNPFVFEGSFQLPALYPPDLLLALWTSPAFASWLLTLHLPLAALAAYWLARELGATRQGAFATGALYSLGGIALSTLNLYVFLQALALAPLVAGGLRRAAVAGGRTVVVAAALLALALTTLAVEFVGQALLLGVVLGAVQRPDRRGLARIGASIALGLGLAGVPLALTLGLLPETVRGSGFSADVALGNSVHPAVLLQSLLPNLFGLPHAPAESWWGGRFFSKGLPYFLSLYVGPLGLGLAAIGFRPMDRRVRIASLVLGGVALWYSLGAAGGLATLVSHLPLASSFRFPSKALLLPALVLAVAAGFGLDRLRRDRAAWRGLAAATGGAAALVASLLVLLVAAPPSLVSWSGVRTDYWPHVVTVAVGDGVVVGILAAVCGVLALGVRGGWVGTGFAAALVAALASADLVRAGAGLNPQVDVSFHRPLPEIRALGLAHLGDERAFSYGLDQSPAFREFLAGGGRGLTLAGTYVSRQVLAPYSNVVDQVETPEAIDLTAFVPRKRELRPEDYAPGEAGRLLPWLRNAAVSRVLSIDPLEHPDLARLARVPVGRTGLDVRVYRLAGTWPRAYLACRVVEAGDDPLLAPYRRGFVPDRDVALAGAAPECSAGAARRVSFAPGHERYEVEADGSGYLVMRDSFARGWRARVDGEEAPVLRANGKHRAVPVPAGARTVVLRYDPPGLYGGLVLTVLSLLVSAGIWLAPLRGSRR